MARHGRGGEIRWPGRAARAILGDVSEQSTSEDTGRGATGADAALRRVLQKAAAQDAGADLLEVLAERLSGTELTTLLLEISRRRALRLTPAEVLRRYREDRFVRPSAVPARALRAAEERLISALPSSFDLLSLAPVTPLATHASVASVDPRKVVATVRASEVAADPTNALSLEAADRRSRLLARDPRSAETVSLAASQRVVRAQRFGAGMSAHFQLFGMVTAGRDTGAQRFEIDALTEHFRFGAGAVPDACFRVTVLAAPYRRVLASVRAALPQAAITEDPSRESGRGYYAGLCFKVHAGGGEVGDGGLTDWTARLLGNRKERQLISGYGVDRLA